MPAQLLDGARLAASIQNQITIEIQHRLKQGLSRPGLAVILVGEAPASVLYVKRKQEAAVACGMHLTLHARATTTRQDTLIDLIQELNKDPSVHGILVQLPLPPSLDPASVLEAIDYRKDVDGLHSRNLGNLAQGRPFLRACTPKGIMTLLHSTKITTKGLHCVVVGASNLVGRPMALELLNQGATVTVCHSATHDLKAHLASADLIVAATGRPHLIHGADIKPGAIAIDVGISRLGGKIVGDLDYESVSKVAAWISPVPGGVGPMTVASLLENTLWAAQYKA